MELDKVIPLGLILAGAALLAAFGPLCGHLARRRNRDTETWFQLGALFGPIALAWIWLLPARPRRNDAELSAARRRRVAPDRIPRNLGAVAPRCYLCNEPLTPQHSCRPEVVEDRIQRRWTVRVGGQRIIGPP